MGHDERLEGPPAMGPERTTPSRAAIRDQLERLLASPYFRNSRRYTSLLRYAVEQTLEGNLDRLKERTLGVEVFGRDPEYDTARDPVVRTSAVEIRKRLSQYYEETGADAGVRIELPPGSYVAEFHPACGPVLAVDTPQAPPPGEAPISRPDSRPRNVGRFWAMVGVVILLAAAVFVLVVTRRVTAVDRFWAPLRQSNAPILFGVAGDATAASESRGNTSSAVNPTMSDIFQSAGRPGSDSAGAPGARNASVPFGDVNALVDIAAYLKAAGRPYRIRFNSTLQFEDLKAGPSVLLGPAVRWLNLVTSNWRFRILRDEPVTVTWVEDREKPGQRLWALSINPPAPSVAETYAVVTRVWNQSTSQVMVNIAGMSPYATSAAGQFLVDPASMEQVAKGVLAGWDKKNIQLVIATQRLGSSNGTPRLLARHFW